MKYQNVLTCFRDAVHQLENARPGSQPVQLVLPNKLEGTQDPLIQQLCSDVFASLNRIALRQCECETELLRAQIALKQTNIVTSANCGISPASPVQTPRSEEDKHIFTRFTDEHDMKPIQSFVLTKVDRDGDKALTNFYVTPLIAHTKLNKNCCHSMMVHL